MSIDEKAFESAWQKQFSTWVLPIDNKSEYRNVIEAYEAAKAPDQPDDSSQVREALGVMLRVFTPHRTAENDEEYREQYDACAFAFEALNNTMPSLKREYSKDRDESHATVDEL